MPVLPMGLTKFDSKPLAVYLVIKGKILDGITGHNIYIRAGSKTILSIVIFHNICRKKIAFRDFGHGETVAGAILVSRNS